TTPIVRIAELQVDPDRIDEFRALLSEEMEISVRVEPGVLFLYAVSIKGSPDKVRVIEGYADQAAYEVHIRSPHFLNYKTKAENRAQTLGLTQKAPIKLAAKAEWASRAGPAGVDQAP